MTGMDEFIREYSFLEMNGVYYGTYSDMHMVLKTEGGKALACLYLDLPPQGRKARREIEDRMNEKGERYCIRLLPEQPHKTFLEIEIPEEADAGSMLDRFLTECDLILRPYGREMGLLCAYCRKEMQEEKPVYRQENGMIVPVCPACASLDNASQAKRGDNRRTIDKKRMRKGLFGAAIGCLISAAVWAVVGTYMGIYLNVIISIASVLLIKWLFEKMSKAPNRLKNVVVMALAVFALIVGTSVGYTIEVNEYNQSWRDWGAEMQTAKEAGTLDPADEARLNDVNSGMMEDITLVDTFMDPLYYIEIAAPLAIVVIVSLTSDSLRLISRKRR